MGNAPKTSDTALRLPTESDEFLDALSLDGSQYSGEAQLEQQRTDYFSDIQVHAYS